MEIKKTQLFDKVIMVQFFKDEIRFRIDYEESQDSSVCVDGKWIRNSYAEQE